MKSLFFILVAICSLQVQATKARLQALGSAVHIIDTQTVFSAPLDLLEQPNYINIESGNTAATTANDNAEGIVSYSLTEKSRIAFSVGHLDESIMTPRAFMNSIIGGSIYRLPQNPVHLLYANKSDESCIYGLGFTYSNYKDKISSLSESSQAAVLALQFGGLQIYNIFGIVNSVEGTANRKMDGSGLWTFNSVYGMGEYTFSLTYTTMKIKSLTNSTENQSHSMTITKIAIDRSEKKDGNDFFYGATLSQTEVKDKLFDHKFSRLILPVIFGYEFQASDLFTLRASLTQTALIAQSKEEITTGTAYPAGTFDGASGAASDLANEQNNTVAAMGLGLKWKNVSVDGTLTGAVGATQTQQVSANSFMSQVGLVYNY